MPESPTPQQRLQAFWNERYAGAPYAYGTAPNSFLVRSLSHLATLPPGAPVLCLADGEGRNGVWLARQGRAVTSLDIAEQGQDKARRLAEREGVAITTLQADVTTHDLGQACWGAIVSIFLHLPAPARRELHRRCVAALRPGGVFVYEAYGPRQLALGTGGPRDVALLPTLAEVQSDFDGLGGLSLLHGWSGVRPVIEGALHHGDGEVVQLVLRKAAA
jgi:SAM-dependent methyltransferase